MDMSIKYINFSFKFYAYFFIYFNCINNYINSNMGITTTRERKKIQIRNEQEMEFYTTLVDPHLGPVKIYSSKNYHLCFILKYQKAQQDTKIFNIFKRIEQLRSSEILSLFGYNIERKTCCSSICSEKVSSYWQYYNYYFNDYLERRRKQQNQQHSMFVDPEIWHIIDVCCKVYSLFRSFGIYYEINPQTLVINPEGKLKAFWCHLKSHNNHLKFFQYFDSNYKICRFPYSPEQLQYMHEQERTTKLNFDKCNSFRLGILLLQCLSLTDPLSNCYNPSMTAINHTSIRNLIITKVVPHYSNELVHLLSCLLRQDPRRRPTLAEVFEQYHHKFDENYELRVCGIKNTGIMENNNDFLMEVDHHKKYSEHSDEKTVKIRHSNRR